MNCVPSVLTANSVLRIPSSDLAGFVDDVVIVEEEQQRLSVFHWDGARFVTRHVLVQFSSTLEHEAFAPINIPLLP